MIEPGAADQGKPAIQGLQPVRPRRPTGPAFLLVGLLVGAVLIIGILALQGGGAPAPSGLPGTSVAIASPGGPSSGPSGAAHVSPSPVPASVVPAPPVSPISARGSIAIVGGDGPLTVVDRQGRGSILAEDPGVTYGFPVWSPDGSRIAVVGSSAANTSITVLAVRPGAIGPQPRPVVIYRSLDRPAFYLYWTPDGRSVSFLATEADGISLRVAPADGSAPLDGSAANTIWRGAPLYYDWIGSSRLVLHVGSGSGAFLGEVGLDGRSAAPALGGAGDFRSAVVSADGRYVGYVRQAATGAGNPGEVVVAARHGGDEHVLPVFGAAAVVFDPTGDTLATIGPERQPRADLAFPIGALRLVDGASGQDRTLLDGLVVAFFWSPDGKTIGALRLQSPGGSTADVDAVLAAAGSPTPTVPPSPAPAAEVHLVFVDVSSGRILSDRVVQPARRFVDQFLPYFDQYALSHQLWAPDSASMLVPTMTDTGATRVEVVPRDGGGDLLSIDGELGFWSP
jgi:TolB protein